MKMVIRYTIPFILVLMHSCTRNIDHLENSKIAVSSKFNKTVIIGDIQYDFKLRTNDAMAIPLVKDGDSTNDYLYSINSNEAVLYVIINHQVNKKKIPILKHLTNNYEVYNERINYYTFHVNKDVYLICNNDTIRPIGHHYENNMELLPYNSMIFVFPDCLDSKNVKILFNDMPFENYFIKASFDI